MHVFETGIEGNRPETMYTQPSRFKAGSPDRNADTQTTPKPPVACVAQLMPGAPTGICTMLLKMDATFIVNMHLVDCIAKLKTFCCQI